MAQWMDQVAEEALEQVERQKTTIAHWHQRAHKAEAALARVEALLRKAEPYVARALPYAGTRDAGDLLAEIRAALRGEGGEDG